MKLGNRFCVILLCCPVIASAATHNVNSIEQLKNALLVSVSNGEDDTIVISEGSYDFIDEGRPLEYIPMGSPEPPESFSLIIQGAGAYSTVFLGRSVCSFLNISTRELADDSLVSIRISGIGFKNPGGRLLIETTSANVELIELSFVTDACIDLDERLWVASSFGAIMLYSSIFDAQVVCSTGGGAELKSDFGEITVTDNEFKGNQNSLFGSGLSINCLDTVAYIGGNVFQNYSTVNMAQFVSGGLHIAGLGNCSVFVESNNFFDNTGSYGGGLAFEGFVRSSIYLKGNTFIGNTSSFDGGGLIVRLETANTLLESNRFWGNKAGESGGAAYIVGIADSVTVMQNNIFVDNEAKLGGAIHSWQGHLTITNNTIHSNYGSDLGGGLSIWLSGNDSTARLYNNIIWNNFSDTDIQDVCIDDDHDDKIVPSDGVGALLEVFNNDLASAIIMIGDNLQEDGNLSVDPLLNQQEKLTEYSPVIDKGDPNAPELPEFDIEGQKRTIDANNDGFEEPDMGADEAVFSVPNPDPIVVSTFPQPDATLVPVDTEIEVIFSKPMDTVTINNQAITLNPPTAGSVSYNSITKTAVFSLNNVELEYNTEYTVTVPTSVEDEAGNPLTAPHIWKFTTIREGGNTPTPDPTDVDVILGNGCMCGSNDPGSFSLIWLICVAGAIVFMTIRAKKT